MPVPDIRTMPADADDESPFHAGEQAVQRRAGSRDRVERAGRRMIRDYMLDQHVELFEKLPFIVVGSLDGEGRPWASILPGRPGFLQAPDPWHLRVDGRPLPGDPLAGNLGAGAPIGLLGIELATRRRNRMNGRVESPEAGGFTVRVEQSFGNCPQYIQARSSDPAALAGTAPRPGAAEGPVLSARARRLVVAADTLFIATASAAATAAAPAGDRSRSEGVDVSHRGGRPGFVRVDEVNGASLLTVPDFRGNALYNTLGNIAANPRAGLVFIDFARGDLLQLTGSAELVWDGPELAAFVGAERLLRFRVAGGGWIEAALSASWSPSEEAPQLAATGRWAG